MTNKETRDHAALMIELATCAPSEYLEEWMDKAESPRALEERAACPTLNLRCLLMKRGYIRELVRRELGGTMGTLRPLFEDDDDEQDEPWRGAP